MLTTSTQLLGPQDRRFSLIISAPASNRITLSFLGAAVLDEGITLHPGGPPLVLEWDTLGGSITASIQAIAAIAAQTIGVVEVFWP